MLDALIKIEKLINKIITKKKGIKNILKKYYLIFKAWTSICIAYN